MIRVLLRAGLGVLWASAAAWITLTPSGAPGSRGTDDVVFQWCLLCGTRITGDAVLNIVLFIPLGLLLGIRWRPWVALLAGLSLSSTIELAQLSIDGRYSSIGDIVWNGLGTGLGALIAAQVRVWAAPGADSVRGRVLAVALPVAYLLLAGIAISPSGTDARYFGQRTPDLAFMPQHTGQVLEASLDGAPIPQGPFAPDSDPRARFAGDWTVRARVIAGPPPTAVSPIVSIYDEDRQEIFSLGAHGHDVFMRERTLGDQARLDRPDVRWWGALQGVQEGDTITLGARRDGRDRCLVLNGEELCGLGVTPGDSWGLLMFLEGAGKRERALLATAWTATLWFLLGLVGGHPRSVMRATALGILLTLGVVAATRLLMPAPLEWLGLGLGVGVGMLMRPVARAFLGGPSR